MIRVQYVSDTHLELCKGRVYSIRREAPILALGGDIGNPYMENYFKFLEYCSETFEHVLLVSGNHEYYHAKHVKRTIAAVDAQIEEVCSQFANVHFLNDRGVVIDGVLYYGTTLWTFIPAGRREPVEGGIADYGNIYAEEGRLLTVRDVNFMHLDKSRKLYTAVKDAPCDTVVITHHCPTSHPASLYHFGADDLRCSFHADMNSLIRAFTDKLRVWIYGHTHKMANFTISNTQLLSNPHGYPGELYTCGDPPVCTHSVRANV